MMINGGTGSEMSDNGDNRDDPCVWFLVSVT